jgi:hypothetical protein
LHEPLGAAFFYRKKFLGACSGVNAFVFVVRNSGCTKFEEIGLILHSSAAEIVNFQEVLYLEKVDDKN